MRMLTLEIIPRAMLIPWALFVGIRLGLTLSGFWVLAQGYSWVVH